MTHARINAAEFFDVILNEQEPVSSLMSLQGGRIAFRHTGDFWNKNINVRSITSIVFPDKATGPWIKLYFNLNEHLTILKKTDTELSFRYFENNETTTTREVEILGLEVLV